MKAYPVLPSPENDLRHDAGVILNESDEFSLVLPVLRDYLNSKIDKVETGSFRQRDLLYTVKGLGFIIEMCESDTLPDSIELSMSPKETAAVQILLGNTDAEQRNQELDMKTRIGMTLAPVYYDQFAISPDILIPTMRDSFESANASV